MGWKSCGGFADPRASGCSGDSDFLNEEQDLAAGCDLGANSYIRKPVGFASLPKPSNPGLYWLILNSLPESEPA
jgi:hypothetical protein